MSSVAPAVTYHGGLVRGGRGEIALRNVVPLGGLITRKTAEPLARKYEQEHPGTVVVCDWELFDDADIAAMSEHQRLQALRDRAALVARKEAAAAIEAKPEPKRSGDPARAAEVLARARRDMSLLEIAHPEYVRLFRDYAAQINELEVVCGQPVTPFKIGENLKVVREKLSADRKLELESKVKAYGALTVSARKNSIEAATDPSLTRLLLDAEERDDIKQMIIIKLFSMGVVA